MVDTIKTEYRNDFKNLGNGYINLDELLNKNKKINNPSNQELDNPLNQEPDNPLNQEPNNSQDQEPKYSTREIELENNPKQKKSILWYGILLNCGILSIACFPGFAFLILPFQAGSFAFIPFNKQTNSFDYSKYKKKLTDEQKDEIDKINEESQKNKELMVPNESEISDKRVEDILSLPSSNGKNIGDEIKEYTEKGKEKSNIREIYNGDLSVNKKAMEALKNFNNKGAKKSFARY